MINKNCNICNSDTIKHLYTPIQSKINLKINVCKKCGHVFSSFDELKFESVNKKNCSNTFTHLSCESDYSDIRVGKQQMVNYFFDAYEKLNTRPNINTILDFKSARGDFAIKALEYFNISSIDCIEEDEYMTDSYINNNKIQISHQKYYYSFENKQYDLVYACHTLEHYQNPIKVLNYIHQKVKDGGLFYIDVPNIDYIDNNLNIDDFFYDKHLHYFSSELLIKIIENIGFTLLNNSTTKNNIGLLFEKRSISKENVVDFEYSQSNENLIKQYVQNLEKNRKEIKHNVNKINNTFALTKPNIIIGCGRALDAIIKYGNLDLSNFDYFVDDFLIKATDSVYGHKLMKLQDIDYVGGVLLLVKNPSDLLLEKIKTIKTKVEYNEIFK